MIEEKGLVSVVISAYKRSDYLRRAIESVMNQTYSKIEIIIVDDNAGNDYRNETKKIVSDLSFPVKVLYPKENLGGSLARNSGADIATGEFIAFLDDDDLYLPSNIEKKINKISNSESDVGIIYSWAKGFGKFGSGLEWKKVYRGNRLFELFYYGNICATSQILVRSKIFRKIGGFDQARGMQDSILLYKFFKNGYQIECVEDFGNLYFIDGQSSISSRVSDQEKFSYFMDNYYKKNQSNFTFFQNLRILYSMKKKMLRLKIKTYL